MKKFFNEYSKVIVIVFLAVCVGVITCDLIQTFMAIKLDRAEPSHILASMAFGTGLMSIFGYGIKSFKQKQSLNDNKLKIDKNGIVSQIPTEPVEDKTCGLK
jgi:hypothetical protein